MCKNDLVPKKIYLGGFSKDTLVIRSDYNSWMDSTSGLVDSFLLVDTGTYRLRFDETFIKVQKKKKKEKEKKEKKMNS